MREGFKETVGGDQRSFSKERLPLSSQCCWVRWTDNTIASVDLVDRPTQLVCIWIFICQQTNIKDIAG